MPRSGCLWALKEKALAFLHLAIWNFIPPPLAHCHPLCREGRMIIYRIHRFIHPPSPWRPLASLVCQGRNQIPFPCASQICKIQMLYPITLPIALAPLLLAKAEPLPLPLCTPPPSSAMAERPPLGPMPPNHAIKSKTKKQALKRTQTGRWPYRCLQNKRPIQNHMPRFNPLSFKVQGQGKNTSTLRNLVAKSRRNPPKSGRQRPMRNADRMPKRWYVDSGVCKINARSRR